MSLESFGVEALQGLFRRLVQDLSDPTLFDFDTQASTGTSGEASVQQAAAPSYEVAAFDQSLEAPGPEAFDNPKSYLQYLKFVLENDLEDMREWYEKYEGDIIPASDGGRIQTGLEPRIRECEGLIRDIEREMGRIGGPRASVLGDFYERAAEIRRAATA